MIESVIIYIALLLTVGFLIIGAALTRIQKELKELKSTQGQEPPITRRGRQI